jgi:hypothetical protein
MCGAAPSTISKHSRALAELWLRNTEIDFRVALQDSLERQAHGLAVIGVQDGLAVGLDHQN